ncbi:MAG: hypothetical protein JWM88_2922 [Verrucomicrobia bacterium]|nr:hypothetical protein [Verrucomicrobiota bacterium]
MIHGSPFPLFFRFVSRARCAFACSLLGLVSVVSAADQTLKSFDLPADAAERSLRLFSAQSGVQVIFPTDTVRGVTTQSVKGDMTAREALDRMLAGTVLVGTQNEKTGLLTIRREASAETAEKNDSSRPASSRTARNEDGTLKLETFEVMESKLLNMDKPRSRDDPQPYVTFGRGQIQNSGATNIEDFLKNRLPMNAVFVNPNQQASFTGNTSTISLRGLGPDQTLILIDGRRAPSIYVGGLSQPDLNGIPLAAVERIEVLPTTASGIYGGSATGGVVNVILRRDYSGLEAKATYENTFGTDTGARRLDLAAGFSMDNGKTNLLFSASYADRNGMSKRDRDFTQRYRFRLLANNNNNYQSFNSGSNPPYGATTNIRSSTGANLVLKNGTALNSPITFVPAGYSGSSSDNGAALAANAGKYNLNWGDSVQSSTTGRTSLFTGSTVEAFSATIRRQCNDLVQLFAEASVSRNASRLLSADSGTVKTAGLLIPTSAATNPFAQDIRVTFPLSALDEHFDTDFRTIRAATGAIVSLPRGWKAEADYVWGQSYGSWRGTITTLTPQTTLSTPSLSALVTSGAANVLRDLNANPLNLSVLGLAMGSRASTYSVTPPRSTLTDASLRLGGPLYPTPAGDIAFTASAGHRDERISEGHGVEEDYPSILPARSQSVESVYAELGIPLVAAKNALPAIQELQFQLSIRDDRYTTHGVTNRVYDAPQFGPDYDLANQPIVRATNHVNSANSTVAMRYAPVRDLTLRASYGTGFLPPSVQQLAATTSAGTPVTIIDPSRGNITNTYVITAFGGGNANLRPEKSKSWSAGLIYQPRLLPGLRLSIDYTRIKKTDAILGPSSQLIVDNQSILPGRVVRGPLTTADQSLGYTAGPINSIDDSLVNLSLAEIEAYDIQVDYEIKTHALGTFDFFVLGTEQLHFRTRLAPTTPLLENVGYFTISSTANSVLKFKGNAGLTWKFDRWTAGWTVNYFGGYYAYNASDSAATVAFRTLNQGSDHIPSQTYHDAFVSYRLPDADSSSRFWSKVRSGTEVTIGIRNIFNKAPPFDAQNTAFGYYSYYGNPRLATYYVMLKHTFN